MASNIATKNGPQFSYLSKIKVQPSFVQGAFICVVEAVLPVDLFEVLAENWLVSENHVAVVAAVRLVPTVQV